MLLIIPAIDLKDGVSTHPIEGLGEESGVGTDPVAIAKLLRIENAKTLHVTDLDGAARRAFGAFDVIRRLVENVDIPIEVSGGISSDDDAARLLDCGACRVVLRPGLLTERPDEAAAIVAKHGSGKVVAAIEHAAAPPGGEDPADPVPSARTAAAMGIRRILYTDLDAPGGTRILNPPMLERLARASGLRVTVSGGVISFDDLRTVQALEQAGVDSVILRRAIYENRFSCQAIWRMAERGDYPYTAKV